MELKVIPVLQVAIAVILMSLLQYYLPDITFSSYVASSVTISLVILLMVIAIVIGFLAIYSFRVHQAAVNPTKPETSSQVVDSGIYKYSRNPMYLAMLLALVAFACYLQSPLNLLICGLFVCYITKYQIVPEERMLIKLFGEDYVSYKNKVRRWL